MEYYSFETTRWKLNKQVTKPTSNISSHFTSRRYLLSADILIMIPLNVYPTQTAVIRRCEDKLMFHHHSRLSESGMCEARPRNISPSHLQRVNAQLGEMCFCIYFSRLITTHLAIMSFRPLRILQALDVAVNKYSQIPKPATPFVEQCRVSGHISSGLIGTVAVLGCFVSIPSPHSTVS